MDYHSKDRSPIEHQTTIAACASARAKAGVALVRISGTQSWHIGEQLIRKTISDARMTHVVTIYDEHKEAIDQAIAIGFRSPTSYTGEDMVEIHCHGSPVVIELILARLYQLGAKPAEPGEFSKRAFLNNKIDLSRAEAIADLINASSKQAARNAMQSLQGVFARRIDDMVTQLTSLRISIEAHIDFPEEETDKQTITHWQHRLKTIEKQCLDLLEKARIGHKINNGFQLVLLGAPNSGKSTLFNALLQTNKAIVTNQAGTTRDILQQPWQLDNLCIELTDTAGLHETEDVIESIGTERAITEGKKADRILYLFTDDNEDFAPLLSVVKENDMSRVTLVRTKIDLLQQSAKMSNHTLHSSRLPKVHLSAKTGDGLDLLRKHIYQEFIGTNQEEDIFSARQRHIDALINSGAALTRCRTVMTNANNLELAAQDLLEAQNHLGHITGRVSADDLLGEIFSHFCIGK